MVQKYTHDGSKMLLQIGKKGVVDSSDGTIKGKPLNSEAAIFPGNRQVVPEPGTLTLLGSGLLGLGSLVKRKLCA